MLSGCASLFKPRCPRVLYIVNTENFPIGRLPRRSKAESSFNECSANSIVFCSPHLKSTGFLLTATRSSGILSFLMSSVVLSSITILWSITWFVTHGDVQSLRNAIQDAGAVWSCRRHHRTSQSPSSTKMSSTRSTRAESSSECQELIRELWSLDRALLEIESVPETQKYAGHGSALRDVRAHHQELRCFDRGIR